MHFDSIKFSKPWWELERLSLNRISTVQFLTIRPWEELSLHYHDIRDDYWKILKGIWKVTLWEDSFVTKENETYFIPKKIPHNVSNIWNENLLVLEICFDDFLDTDTTRVSDCYWRI